MTKEIKVTIRYTTKMCGEYLDKDYKDFKYCDMYSGEGGCMVYKEYCGEDSHRYPTRCRKCRMVNK